MNKIIKNPLAIIIIVVVTVLIGCKKENVPVITTTSVTAITGTSAVSGGGITDEGSSTVTSRGVCWSTGTTPTISDSKTTDGAGVGSFSSNLTLLNGATNYYVRAYATNTAGTGYGMAMSFTTLGQSPTPTVASASNITATGATLNGSVNANYLSTVVTLEYGTSTSYGSTVTATQSPLTGNTSTNISADITGLTAGTIYHYRTKAVNTLGTTYSDDITFTTLGQVPTVITLTATNINVTSATLNGSVNANYISTIITFEYGLNTSYGSTNSATHSPITGNTITNVSVSITGLVGGTTYHFRVKAVNSLGTTYGSDLTFTTFGQIPTTTTMAATNITTVAAQLNATVNANYLESAITFDYGTSVSYGSTVSATQSPVIGNTITNVNANIAGLTGGTTYHYRAKAVNSLGTSLGNDMSFATVPAIVNDVDGNTYDVISIGTQIWMAGNLKTTKYRDGTIIPLVTDNTSWSNLTSGAYSDYSNTPSTSITYGRLYNWYAINDGHNVCPIGWHVPIDAEWTTLITYLGGNNVAGGALKEVGTLHWLTPNDGATNLSGFTALGSGYRGNDGIFSNLDYSGIFWSATEDNATYAWYRVIVYYSSFVMRTNFYKSNGFSVRCMRD